MVSSNASLRKDPLSKSWILYAPIRGHRPRTIFNDAKNFSQQPPHDPSCPFCRYREDQPIQPLAIQLGHDRSNALLCLANPFPLLAPPTSDEPEVGHPVRGLHEVIVEGLNHNSDPLAWSEPDLKELICFWSKRIEHHFANPECSVVILVKNKGANAGASIAHPHSQILACHDPLPLTAPTWSGFIHAEVTLGGRILFSTDHLSVVTPSVTAYAGECWIVGMQPSTTFSNATAADFGSALKRIVQGLTKLDSADAYNIILTFHKSRDGAPKWFARFVPRGRPCNGLDLALGVKTNSIMPAEDFTRLKSCF